MKGCSLRLSRYKHYSDAQNEKRSKEAFGLSLETEPDDFDDDDDAYDDNIELAVAVKEVNKKQMKHCL